MLPEDEALLEDKVVPDDEAIPDDKGGGGKFEGEDEIPKYELSHPGTLTQSA